MKKRIAILLVVAMLLSLCACNTNTTKPTQPSDTKPGTNETNPNATNPTETQPPIETEPLPTADPNANTINTVDELLAALNMSKTGGSYVLGADITIPDTTTTVDMIKVIRDTTLDLNGKTLTINVTDGNNIISVQYDNDAPDEEKNPVTFTLIDSVGGGKISAVACNAEAKGTLFRVNVQSSKKHSLIINGGTYEYIAQDGVRVAPFMFNITKDAVVNVTNGSFYVGTGSLYNPGNKTMMQATGGKFSVQDSAILAAGYGFREVTEGGKTWYYVVKGGDTTEPTGPVSTEPTPTVPSTVVDIKTADEFMKHMTSAEPGSYRLAANIDVTITDGSSSGIKVIASKNLDLNGKTVTITTTFRKNIISVQGNTAVTTLTLSDSVGTGKMKMITNISEYTSWPFRVNEISGTMNHLVITGGTYEVINSEGNISTRQFFNITKGGPSVTVTGGTFIGANGGKIYINATKPIVMGGKWITDPADAVAKGYTVTKQGDYYVVTKDSSYVPTEPKPTEPKPTTPAEPSTVVVVTTAADLRTKMQEGAHVKLGANITYDLADHIRMEAGIVSVLDLNGYTITHTSPDRLFNLIHSKVEDAPGSKLTICDSSAAGTGKITSDQKGLIRLNTGKQDAELYISGGTFICTGEKGVFWSKATAVTGGSFSNDPSAFVDLSKYTVTQAGGMFTVTKKNAEPNPTTPPATEPPATEPPATEPQPTAPSAPEGFVGVSDIAGLKDTLIGGKNAYLVADISFENTADNIMKAATITGTLDLNGHTITITMANANNHVFNLLVGSHLTINDSSDAKTGTIRAIWNGAKASVIRVNGSASAQAALTVNGGTFLYEPAEGADTSSTDNRYIVHSNGDVVLNGGVFTSTNGHDPVYQYNGTGTLTVNGGSYSPAIKYKTGANVNFNAELFEVKAIDDVYFHVTAKTVAPQPTEPPATEPPATEPPATEPPATEPPATEPPATEPPATEPPATEPPATEPPATEPPATEPERIAISNADEFWAYMESSTDGYYYLAEDISTEISANGIRVVANIDLDLNGKTVTLTVKAGKNIFSIQGKTNPTLTLNDSVGTGKIVADIKIDSYSSSFFRGNKMSGSPNHVVINGGTYEFVGGGKYLFNTTEPSTAIINGGTFLAGPAALYNTNNVAPVINAGSFSVDPSGCLDPEKAVVTEVEGMFIVTSTGAEPEQPTEPEVTEPQPTEPEPTESDVPEGYVAVGSASELQAVLTSGGKAWLTQDLSFKNSEYTFVLKGSQESFVLSTLDLNGKTITVEIDSTSHIFNLQLAEFVVLDSSAEQKGTIKAIWNGVNAGMFRVNGGASESILLILGGTFLYETAEGADTTASGNRYVVHSNGYTVLHDGYFKSTNGCNAVYGYGGHLQVKGGYYYEIPKTKNIELITDLGYVLSKEPIDGWYVVVPNVPEGYTGVTNIAELKEALLAGQNAYLVGDIAYENTADNQITMKDAAAILDLNGHVITITINGTAHPFNLVAGSDLTIKDSSEAQTGGITGIWTGVKASMIRVNGGNSEGKLTIEAGTFQYLAGEGTDTSVSLNRYLIHSNGVVVINGGSFMSTNGYAAVYQYGETGVMTINDGKFNPTVKVGEGAVVVYPEGYFMSYAPVDGWFVPVKPELGENETPEEEL